MKQKLIKDLHPGDSVISFWVVRKKEIKEKKANRELYITFEFGDSSGRIRGSVWDNVEQANKDIQISDIIKVKGRVITYNSYPHISIEKIRKALSEDKITLEEFLPKSGQNIDELYDSLIKIMDSIKDPSLKKLVNLFFNDKNLKEKFITASAAKLWHHNYKGGLVEHTLSLTQICDFLQQHYPGINRDLLLTAALLHDIGKIVELDAKGFFNYSTEGRLIGHITIAVQIISEKISQVKDFPDSLRKELLHCILSHHGQKEHGSPVEPMTLEALLLSYADEIDSKINAFLRIMKKEKEPGKVWSNYVNLLDRFIYFGEE